MSNSICLPFIPEEFISVNAAAKLKKCSRPTIYSWASDGSIDSVKIAGKIIIVNNEKLAAISKKTHTETIAKTYQIRRSHVPQ